MRHQAQECGSKNTSQRSGNRHHSSMFERLPSNNQIQLVTGDHEASVIYPEVVVVVDGITGTDNSYASAALVERLNKHPTHVEHKTPGGVKVGCIGTHSHFGPLIRGQ